MGAKKSTKKTSKIKGAASKVKSAIGAKLGIKSKGGSRGRRHHGLTWWSNRLLIEKLKKRYFKLKYGGR